VYFLSGFEPRRFENGKKYAWKTPLLYLPEMVSAHFTAEKAAKDLQSRMPTRTASKTM